jgi:hypothetical protein
MIVVIPSCREVHLDHLVPLIDSGARFIVVDDSEGRIHVDHPSFEVYNWRDQEKLLGGLRHAIPRGNGACRDFGFLLAWRDGEKGEVVVALDDDCRIEAHDFAEQAEAALEPAVRPQPLDTGRHWNVLDLYENTPDGLFPRGFPYSHRPGYRRRSFGDPVDVPPVFSLGLWQGVFDVNAIDKIEGPPYVHDAARLEHPSVVVPAGSLVSVCSMNMVFRREVIPAAYQLPMAVDVMDGWRVDRYGDIWGGFFLKAILDRKGDVMAVGGPMIRHLKEGPYERNIWQEHVCHLVNDEVLALLEDLPGAPEDSYLELVEQLANHLEAAAPSSSPLLRPYLETLVPTLGAWTAALRANESGADTSSW